ncbi:MAG: phosphoglycerate dehydrogenase [Phycisphaeraceae bacterium]|nr:phosphoglycerate dehydrogenase [Phycisphaeraceae bacterium]
MSGKFKILVADKLAEEGLAFIRNQPDAELVNKPGLSEADLAAIAGQHDGMLVRSGVQVTAKVLENPGQLKAIARAGVGVDNIDLDAATQHGILVLNSAEASTISTAEHAFTLLMALCRRVGPAHLTMHQGGWDRNKFMGTQLSGKTLGVVGFGRIGQTMADRALAFGMSVVAYDPFINADVMMDGKVKMFREFTELLPHADLLTFHVPLNDDTKSMLNLQTFGLCRKGVLVVNAARGGVVDEGDLIKALDQGLCGGAALDVFTDEPPAADCPLRKHPKILLTPHLGASTHEAQLAVSVSAADSLLAYLRGQSVRGAVNAGGFRVDLDPMQQRFVDLAQRMAALISPICTRGIVSVNLEIAGGELKPALGTIERTALIGLLRQHVNAAVNIINITSIAKQRGIEVRTTFVEQTKMGLPQLTIEVSGPPGSVTAATHPADRTRRIVGRVYDDLRPRVIEINGYFRDMVPAGTMVLIRNEDRPGMVGLVGNEMGAAGVNIADMAISRRDVTALMLLKVDGEPDSRLFDGLRQKPGILFVSPVKLPPERA